VAAVRQIADPELTADLSAATVSWAIGHLTTLPGAFDPARWLAHRTEVALGTVRSLTSLGLPVDDRVATVAAALGAGPEPVGSGPVLRPNWAGPFNLRALAAASVDRDWLDARIAEDRGGNYARMHALARGLDGRRNWADVRWWATLASELPMSESFASAFLDILVAAGWATTGEA
jgi:hypothetical protein